MEVRLLPRLHYKTSELESLGVEHGNLDFTYECFSGGSDKRFVNHQRELDGVVTPTVTMGSLNADTAIGSKVPLYLSFHVPCIKLVLGAGRDEFPTHCLHMWRVFS